MIVNTTFRGPGGLARHLQRVDTNEAVHVRDDLSTGCALDVADAVADFAVLGRVRGVERSLIHISLSPERSLTPQQERRMIAHLRAVYDAPADHPALVVAHTKPGETDRPTHYHVVMPRMRADGRRISDAYYKLKNERLSLELEFDFGHPLTPGPNIAAARRALDVERPDMHSAIAGLKRPAPNVAKTTVADKSAAVDVGLDLAAFDARAFKAWRMGAVADAEKLRTYGLALMRGDKVVMIVDVTTGYSAPFRRLVNREAKRQGDPSRIAREADIAALVDVARLPALAPARAEMIATSAEQQRAMYRCTKAVEDWVVGSSPGMSPKARATARDTADEARKSARPGHQQDSIRAHLDTIRQFERLAMESRKRAAEHAWRKAKIWRSRSMAEYVGLAAAGAAIASGAGILMTVAAYQLATRLAVARARRLQEEALQASAEVKKTRAAFAEQREAYFARVRAARCFRLDDIPVGAQIAVGWLYVSLVRIHKWDAPVAAALDRVAPGLSAKVRDVAECGTSVKMAQILGRMYRPRNEAHQRALDAFITANVSRGGGEPAPARAAPNRPRSRSDRGWSC